MADIEARIDSASPKNLKKRKAREISDIFVVLVAFQVAAFGGFCWYHMQTEQIRNQSKYTVRQPTEWEKCMASSTLSSGESWQQPYLSFPPKRNISLEEAFRSKGTTIYFLHQRKNGGTSLSNILVNRYAELIENEIVKRYKSTGEAFGLERDETEDPAFPIETYAKETGKDEAMKRTFAPCLVGYGCSHDEMRVSEYFSGDKKVVVGRHMTYHIPFARSIYEDQVLITNFRNPSKRVESCIKYRFPKLSKIVLDTKNFSVRNAERVLLTAKDTKSGSSCFGEAFRILTPYDPDLPVPAADVKKVCCYVKTGFHIVDFDHSGRDMTQIEAELMERLSTEHEENKNKKQFSSRYQNNMDTLIEHLIANNPVLQSEMQLYDCIQDGR